MTGLVRFCKRESNSKPKGNAGMCNLVRRVRFPGSHALPVDESDGELANFGLYILDMCENVQVQCDVGLVGE
jgi:hypothetical protein